jgi:hypothetical protein
VVAGRTVAFGVQAGAAEVVAVTEYSFDGSRTVLGSRAAVVVAVFASFVLGVTAGYLVQTLLGIAGGVVFGVAARDLAADELRARIRGSSLLLVASVLVVAALGLRKAGVMDAVVVAMVPLAVGTTTLGALVDPVEGGGAVFAALGRTFLATVVGTLLAAALYADVFLGTVTFAWDALNDGLAGSSFFGFVVLQVELLVVGILATKAGAAAADLEPGRSADDLDTVGLFDVPRVVWALLIVQVLVLTFPGGAALFEYVLGLAGVVGFYVGVVLSSIYLHGALVVLACVLAVLPFVVLARSMAVSFVGSRPPRSLAFATGGVGFSAVVILLTSVPGVSELVTYVAGSDSVAGAFFSAYGVGPSVLAMVTGVLVVIGFCLFMYATVLSLSFVPSEASAFAFGGVALFVGACAGAFADVPAPAVFIAMAGALLTWDFGEFSTRLGAELGRFATTKPVEAVHGVGSLAVGVLAVVMAALATHFFVPVMTEVSKARALTGLGLSTIAILAFAYLATTATVEDVEEN